jgi:ABC-type lipoprotein export system ATPase subunit
MTNSISAQHISKYYNAGRQNEVRALHDVSLEIESGELVAIIGPSGSGKSTLMHILGVLDRPQTGSLTLRGTDITKLPQRALPLIRAREVGFVFQGFNLLSTLTALENVAEAALYAGKNTSEARQLAREILDKVGLSDRLNNFPNQLSGGQQQRVAIARALVNTPAILLGDEPTGELDSLNAKLIMDLLIRLNTEEGQTVVIVTHNQEVADRCRTIITMKDGAIETIKRRS